MKEKPIGIFDSGVGGTSILKEIIKRLPNENTIYLADSKNAPYGNKTKDEIINICVKNTQFLINKGAKIIVVACNTATTNAIDVLRKKFDIPFIGIEPAIKPAALATKTKSIGILATKGTLASSLFHETAHKFASDITVVEQEGTGLVPLIETGNTYSLETENLLKQYLESMIKNNIDHLVLGCSHYPYLIPVIKKIIGYEVKIIDSGYAVAKQTEKILSDHGLLNTITPQIKHHLMSNSDINVLDNVTHEIKNKLIEVINF